jgi:hypothetical protein
MNPQLVHRQGESELRKGQTPAKLRQPEERRKKEAREGGSREAVTSRLGATLNRESFISVNCRGYAERRIVLTETSPFEETELPLLVTRIARHSPLPLLHLSYPSRANRQDDIRITTARFDLIRCFLLKSPETRENRGI